ncbi:MAG: toxin-antitoxin system YwqK family antitoxin [Myxococcota bacterium]
MTIKVDFDELDTTNDGYGDTILNGKLYSGVAYERFENGAALRSVSGFRSGKLHGASREWYASGRLKDETFYHMGAYHGPVRKWYPDGALQEEGYWEQGIRIREKQWGTDGVLLKEMSIRPDSADYQALLERRAAYKDVPVVDIDMQTLEFVERPAGWGSDAS